MVRTRSIPTVGENRSGRSGNTPEAAAVPLPEHGSAGPPRPKLVLRVGVSGHRPNHLEEADIGVLRRRVHDVLELIHRALKDARGDAGAVYAEGEGTVRVISSVAEGADRLVATEALALGFELQCPLPFSREEYAQDFETAEARAEYHTLLDASTAVIELDGKRGSSAEQAAAYRAAGRMMLNQCDILIAVWDGEGARGVGGTAEIEREAVERGIPTVWIGLPRLTLQAFSCPKEVG